MPRRFWAICLFGIIAAGILSRTVATGFVLIDKYLGDALYAAMVYVILRLFRVTTHVAVWAMLAMTAIELFQLTRIPAAMLASEDRAVSIAGRLLGTEFSILDLVAYAAGIVCMFALDRKWKSTAASASL